MLLIKRRELLWQHSFKVQFCTVFRSHCQKTYLSSWKHCLRRDLSYLHKQCCCEWKMNHNGFSSPKQCFNVWISLAQTPRTKINILKISHSRFFYFITSPNWSLINVLKNANYWRFVTTYRCGSCKDFMTNAQTVENTVMTSRNRCN